MAKKFWNVAACLSLLAVTSSCFDDTLDILNKDLSLNLEIGNQGFIIPVGSFEPIKLSDYLSSFEGLITEDGVLTITQTDSFLQEVASISGDEGLVISDNSIQKVITPQITSFELPEFEIDYTNEEMAADDIGTIVQGDKVDIYISKINPLNEAVVSYLTASQITISNQSLGEDFSQSMEFSDLGDDMVLPVEVKSIEWVSFNESELSTLRIDASTLKVLFDGDFEIFYPSISFTISEGYELKLPVGSEAILGANKRTITIEDQRVSGSLDIDFYFVRYEPNEPLTADDDIGGAFECTITAPSISGTSRGDGSNSASIDIIVEAVAEIDDILVNTQDILFDITASTADNILVLEALPANVGSINYVEFNTPDNKLTLSISPIDLGDLALDDLNSDDVKLTFDPAFVFEEITPQTTSAEGGLEVIIPKEEFLSKSGYTRELTLKALKLSESNQNFGQTYVSEDEGSEELLRDLTITLGITASASDDPTKENIEFIVAGQITQNEFNSLYDESFATTIKSDMLTVKDAEFTLDYVTAEIATGTSAMSVSETISSSLESLYRGRLKENVFVTIEVYLSNVLESIGDMSFDRFVVDFPKYLTFAEPSDSNSNQYIENNVLTLGRDNSLFEQSLKNRTYLAQFEVEGLDFTASQYADVLKDNPDATSDDDAKILTLSEDITYSGYIYFNESDVSLEEQDLMIGHFRFSLDEMVIAEIDANISLDMDLPTTTLELGDMTESLGDDFSLSMILTKPRIEMNVKNPLYIDIEVENLKISTYDADSIPTSINVDNFIIPSKLVEDEDYTEHKIVLSPTGSASQDGTNVKADGLGDLFKDGIPNSLEITMGAGVAPLAQGEYYTLDLLNDYDIEFEYNVVIPMAVEDLSVVLPTSFEGISSATATVAEYTSAFKLSIDAVSEIPIELCISDIKTYDEFGEELIFANILGETDKAVIAAAQTNDDGTTIATQSSISLDLSQGGEDALANLDKIELTISINSPEGKSVELRDDQSINLHLMIELPEGLSINLGTLQNQE